VGRHKIDCGYPLVRDILRLCFRTDQIHDGKSVEDLFSDALERGDHVPLTNLVDSLAGC